MSGHRSTRKRCGDSHPESPVGFGHMSTTGCILNKLFQLPTPPLSRHQLKRLEEHRYQSAGRSLLEPLMQGYWEWLVGRVPSWIAPNLITIIGLSINICTTILLVFYCPTATEQAPLWAYIACACGLFIYQSLDAIDGKQARRTNSSSPLGELLIMAVTHYQQFLWFLERVLQCNLGQILTGCFFVVLLGHSCSTVHTGKHTFLEHCDLE